LFQILPLDHNIEIRHDQVFIPKDQKPAITWMRYSGWRNMADRENAFGGQNCREIEHLIQYEVLHFF